ncbi:hypothetical protein EC99P2_00052 [Enterococcus phage EC99P2]|nr:hypothetical protein EC99P2_00052 [Enterococcus phage EC99P2]
MENSAVFKRQFRRLSKDRESPIAHAYKVYPDGTVQMTNLTRAITLRKFLPDMEPGVYGAEEKNFPSTIIRYANTPEYAEHTAPVAVADLRKVCKLQSKEKEHQTFIIREGRLFTRNLSNSPMQESLEMVDEGGAIFTLAIKEIKRLNQLADQLEATVVRFTVTGSLKPVFVDVRKDCVVAIAPIRLG